MKKMKLILSFFLFALWISPSFLKAESDPPTDRVPMRDARARALRVAPGKVRDFEFEIRKDKWVYFFKINGKDHRVHRIVVDAVTGKILSKTSEPMAIETKVPNSASLNPTPEK